MKHEDKQLLLKDLCARLPYHVRLKVWLKDGTTEEGFLDLEHNYADVLRDTFYYNKIIDIKPYLRPMSSMTKDEKSKFYDICTTLAEDKCHFIMEGFIDSNFMLEKFSYLDSIHVDYRGLIPMGLAIEAPKGMYNIN